MALTKLEKTAIWIYAFVTLEREELRVMRLAGKITRQQELSGRKQIRQRISQLPRAIQELVAS